MLLKLFTPLKMVQVGDTLPQCRLPIKLFSGMYSMIVNLIRLKRPKKRDISFDVRILTIPSISRLQTEKRMGLPL